MNFDLVIHHLVGQTKVKRREFGGEEAFGRCTHMFL